MHSADAIVDFDDDSVDVLIDGPDEDGECVGSDDGSFSEADNADEDLVVQL